MFINDVGAISSNIMPKWDEAGQGSMTTLSRSTSSDTITGKLVFLCLGWPAYVRFGEPTF